MKKIIVILTVTITLIACSKKTDTPINPETVISQILGYWNFDSSMDLRYKNNILVPKESDTTRGIAGDYFDFRLDSKLYIKISANAPNDKDTGTYSYINNKLFAQGPEGNILEFTINELNANRFTFEAKDDIDPNNTGNYTKRIFTLKSKNRM